jgi:hypothetical protein
MLRYEFAGITCHAAEKSAVALLHEFHVCLMLVNVHHINNDYGMSNTYGLVDILDFSVSDF